jgi:hypothetical protein
MKKRKSNYLTYPKANQLNLQKERQAIKSKCNISGKEVFDATFNISENGCNFYWFYSAVCNNPNWQGYWGYGFIGAGLIIGAFNELILKNKKPDAYKVTSIIIEQGVTAGIIVGYLQDFVPETSIPWAVAADATLIIFTGVGALWHLKLKQSLYQKYDCNSKLYVIGNIVKFFYDGLLGAGLAYYGQGLAESFNIKVSTVTASISQGVTGLIYAGTNLFTISPNVFKKPYCKNPLRLIYSALNLTLNTLSYSFDFTYIAFQILMDSFAAYEANQGQKDYVTTNQLIISSTIALLIFLVSNWHYGKVCKQNIEETEDETERTEHTDLLWNASNDSLDVEQPRTYGSIRTDEDEEKTQSEIIILAKEPPSTITKNGNWYKFWQNLYQDDSKTPSAENVKKQERRFCC